MHNERFWQDEDLYLATMFFLKLDMRLTHPRVGNGGETGLRKMLLAQRSLSTLAKVLRREEMRTQLDMLKMVIRYNYRPPRQSSKTMLGVPAAEVGRLSWEGWGEVGRKNRFVGICELVMKEGIRRRLRLQECYIDMMRYGYIDSKTYQDIKRKPVREGEAGTKDGNSKSKGGENGDGELGVGNDPMEEVQEDRAMGSGPSEQCSAHSNG